MAKAENILHNEWFPFAISAFPDRIIYPLWIILLIMTKAFALLAYNETRRMIRRQSAI